uniref:Uncharacterized protein n=1 Tax=Heterorhabditis bacteriophora TaxID=37862 RepID=A0A1I7X557_HETBA
MNHQPKQAIVYRNFLILKNFYTMIYRLTYITGARIMNRRNRPSNGTLKSIGSNVTNVFDKMYVAKWNKLSIKRLSVVSKMKKKLMLKKTLARYI